MSQAAAGISQMRKFWKFSRISAPLTWARRVGGAYRDKACEVSLSDMTDALLGVGGFRHDLLHCL